MKRLPLIVVCCLLWSAVASGGAFVRVTHPKGEARKAAAPAVDPREEPDPVPEPRPDPKPLPPPEPVPVPVPIVPPLPTLELPAQVEGDAGTFIAVKAVTNGLQVKWIALDKGLAVFPSDLLKDATSTVVQSATGGSYRLMAITARGDVLSDPKTVMVVVHGAQPPPKPEPKPDPAPQPPPPPPEPAPEPSVVAGPIRVATIDVAMGRTDEISDLILDIPYWVGIASRTGYPVEQLNAGTDQANKYKPWTEKTGLPALVLRHATTGKVRYSGPLPTGNDSRQKISDLVRLYSGK